MPKYPGVTFVPNPAFGAELVRSSAVKKLLEALAEEGATIYRDGVPVAEGDLRDSVFGDVALTSDGFVGRIGARDWKAALVEIGSSLHDPDGSLRRAIESIGLEVSTVGIGDR